MTNGKIDQNFRTALFGVSSADGETPVRAEIDPNSGRLLTDVSGTVAATLSEPISVDDNGGSLTIDASSLPLPVGAATSANQQTDALTDTQLRATPVPVTGTFFQATQPVSAASLPLPSGAATSAKQDTIITHVDGIETLIGTTNTTLGTIDTDTGNISTKIDTLAGAVSGTEMQVDVVGALPAGTNNIGDVDIATLPTVSTSTDISLASAATSAQLLASNTARKGLLLTNTDVNSVYLYYGTTATATKFSVTIPAGAYWEMPQPIYTGRIDAIWAADGSGSLIGSEL